MGFVNAVINIVNKLLPGLLLGLADFHPKN